MELTSIKHYLILYKDTELEVAAKSQKEAVEIAQLYIKNCLDTPEILDGACELNAISLIQME